MCARAIVGILLLLLASCTRANEQGLNPGDAAPQFTLQSLSGRTESLAAMHGKVVILNFWASWCGPCVSEMPALERAYQKLHSSGLNVLAVAVEDRLEAVTEFQRKYSLSFPIVLDSSGKTNALYHVNGFPETFIINKRGEIVFFADPESREPATRIVGPREWDSPDMIARLEQLLHEEASS